MAKMTRQEGKEDLLRRIEQAKNSEFDIKKIEFNSFEKGSESKLSERGGAMFKERLKITGKKLINKLGEVLLVVVILSVIICVAFLAVKYPIFGTTIEYIFYVILGLFFLIVLLGLILAAYEFIHWLFIEPYRESKKK